MRHTSLIFLLALATLGGCRGPRHFDGLQTAGFVPGEALAESNRDTRLDAGRALVERSGRSVKLLSVTSFSFQELAGANPRSLLIDSAQRAGFEVRDGSPVLLVVETSDGGHQGVPITWTPGRSGWLVRLGHEGFPRVLDAEVMERLQSNLRASGISSSQGAVTGVATDALYDDEGLVPAIHAGCAELGWTCGEPEPGQDCCFFPVLDPLGEKLGTVAVYLWGVVEVPLMGSAAGEEPHLLASILEHWGRTPAPSADSSLIQVEYEGYPPVHLAPRTRPATKREPPADAVWIPPQVGDWALVTHCGRSLPTAEKIECTRQRIEMTRIQHQDWIDMPIRDILAVLRTATGASIVDLTYDAPRPRVTMRVEDASARTVLTQLLERLHRRWEIDTDGVIIITLNDALAVRCLRKP